MLLCKRRHGYLRRHVFWTLAIVGVAPCWAEDEPQNQVRAADGKRTAAQVDPAIDLTIVGEIDSKPSVPSNLMLVSDGWQARKSVDPSIPLLDPAPSTPSDATEPGLLSDVKPLNSDKDTAFKSTMRIVIPETAITRTASPNTATPITTSPSTKSPKPLAPKVELDTLSPHSLYGPGPVTQSKTPNASSLDKIDELLKNLSTLNLEPPQVVNPEQNEPAGEPRTKTPLHCGGEDSETLSMVPDEADDLQSISDGDVELTELGSEPTNDIKPLPGRLEVRGLKRLTEGTVDPPSLSRSTPADPISRREAARESDKSTSRVPSKLDPVARDDAKQSIGDEPTQLPAPANKSGDRISPNKELILSIGMDGTQNRVNANTARLRVSIERTLRHYWATPEDAKERTHWGMFHNLMIYDKDTLITDGKRRYNAVAWMAGNNPCRHQLLFEQDDRGINVKSGVGLQGHQGQLLAVFGLIDVPAAYPIYVEQHKYTVEDVIRREMLDCKTGNELTFTLIGLSHYIDTNSRWQNQEGQEWNFERLIKEELSQPIVGAACGGTHRLMGFAHVLRRRRAEGRPITGQWERADRYVKDFIAYTWQLQNRDGSMSTSWFEKSEDNGEIDRKIQTTGHMVEFLLTALPDDQLQSPQMLRSMTFLVNTLYEERGHDWAVGPKGHALRSLAMYYRRVFDKPDPWRPVAVARHGVSTSR